MDSTIDLLIHSVNNQLNTVDYAMEYEWESTRTRLRNQISCSEVFNISLLRPALKQPISDLQIGNPHFKAPNFVVSLLITQYGTKI